MTLPATQRISRHHTDSSGNTVNLQTLHWHFRQHSEAPNTTLTLQATQRTSRHHTDISSNTANLQTPHWHFRQYSKSPDTTLTLQATQWNSRHHNDTSGNTANLQTTQWLIRDHSKSPDTTMTHQGPQQISRHHNVIQMPLFSLLFHHSFVAGTACSDNTTEMAEPSVLMSVQPSYFYLHSTTFRSQCRTQTVQYFTPGMHKYRTIKFVQWGVIFVGPQRKSGAQNFEIFPRFLKKYVHPCFTGTLKMNLRTIIEDVSFCKWHPCYCKPTHN
jgi:hypothetical protein